MDEDVKGLVVVAVVLFVFFSLLVYSTYTTDPNIALPAYPGIVVPF